MKPYLNKLILGVCIIITAVILANAFTNRNKSNNTISVTGLGAKDFNSDLIVWSGSFMKKNLNLKEAYSDLDKDREKIKSYLVGKGINQSNMIFSAVIITKEYDYVLDKNDVKVKSNFNGYMLNQNIQIESNEVDEIENISRQVTELINSGVEFYSVNPKYYYTKLAQLKIEMIAEATKDANNRAKKIAENSGSEVGKLKKAEMGVFQIVAQNSSEDYSWGGSFNTTSKKKTASITVKLDYEIK